MKKIILFLVCMALISAMFVYGAQEDTPSVQLSLLNQDPNPARAGDTVSLRFKIENTGGKAVKSVNIELVQDYPFTLASGESTKSVANLGAYQTGKSYDTIEYIVKIDKDASQGPKQLQARYSYASGVWENLYLSINIMSKEFAQTIYVDKSRLDPGRETEMKFTIVNTGNTPLKNMVFSWQEPTGAILPVYSSDTKYVKYLDTGQSVDLVYKVIADVNAKPGLYQLNLNLKSELLTNSTSTSISTKAGIFIGGETDFDVAFSESSQGQTSLSVANTGNNPAQSVSVRIPQQDSFRVAGSSSAIIGNLDKGDYTIVSFQIVSVSLQNFSGQRRQQSQQDSSQKPRLNISSANNALKVVIEYTDTTGERRTVEKSVPIQFRSAAEQGSAGYSLQAKSSSGFIGGTYFRIIAAVLLVIAVIVFRKKPRRDAILGIFSKGK